MGFLRTFDAEVNLESFEPITTRSERVRARVPDFQLEDRLPTSRQGAVPLGERRVGLRGPLAPRADHRSSHGGHSARLHLWTCKGRRPVREKGGGVEKIEFGGANDHSGRDAAQAFDSPTH